MLDTGFPRADAENDFLRARRRQVLAALSHRLRGQPRDSDRLLTLDELVGPLGWRVERQLGLQSIPLNTIVGTVDSPHDFDRHFRPTSNRVRPRWEQLALAQRRGAAIPPIEVYRVGGLHFVSDGHHRVSIAAATGQQTIDAYVTEIRTTSAASAWPGASGFGTSAAMSIPISAIAATTAGFTALTGSDPAEVTRTRPAAARASRAAAICDRPALWVHMNSTTGTSPITALFSCQGRVKH
jgi:hypothetical protein